MKSIILVLVTLFAAVPSCLDRGTDVPPGLNPADLGRVILSFSNPPPGIAQVIAQISRQGHNTRVIQLTISDTTQSATGAFTDVIAGPWHLRVEALDDSGIVRYQGETDVNVIGGQIAHVSLHLVPTTGGIEIEVTWGGVPPSSLGLVAYYPFNGNVNDGSGNGNNGSVHGAVLTTDRHGNPNSAFDFDGVGNYLEVPHSPSLQPPTELSVCAWVRPASFYTGICQANDIVHKGVADHEAGCYVLRYTDNGISNDCFDINDLDQHFDFWIVFDDYDRRVVRGTRRVMLNDWQFVVGTYDGSSMKLYVNGILDASFQTSGSLRINTRNLFIGKDDHTQYPYLVNGKIDDVRIYNRALTATEVQNLYNQP